MRSKQLATLLLTAAVLGAGGTASAQAPAASAAQEPAANAAEERATAAVQERVPSLPATSSDERQPSSLGPFSDIGAYFTAPLRWDGRDWAWFGGAILAIGLAHRYDSQVRSHFVGPGPAPNLNSEDTKDAIPAAAVFGGTWALALLTHDNDGYREGWAMVEAAALSGVTDYALKFAAGRDTPEQTSNPNQWFRSGSSFPSLHSSEAFAIGTVLAESGNDDYRFLRRLLGYGVGAFTSYERLKHNAHWLSDTVAGAALGVSSAHFVMDRRYGAASEARLAIVPIEGGAMLTYKVSMP